MTVLTFSPPSGVSAPTYGIDQIRTIIDTTAQALGVPPALAEADAIQESGMNPYAVGDSGTSFGEFQLHEGGELGNLPGTLAQQKLEAFDPATNAAVALREMAAVYKQNPNADPGAIAAAAERPANQTAYAAAVDKILAGGNQTPGGSSSSSSTSTSSSGVESAGLFGASGWNPLNWPGQILDSGVSGVWDQVQPFLVTGMFAVGAIALFVIGAKQLVQPTIDKTEHVAGDVAKAGAVAA
ncbi:MAG TPA: transglycosylase SLT domain-containing protein [Acidothermaceae bacterium]|jgi:hypothetical protein